MMRWFNLSSLFDYDLFKTKRIPVILRRNYKKSQYYDPGQNIWHKVEKSSKVGQDFKSLLSNFACFLTAIIKV